MSINTYNPSKRFGHMGLSTKPPLDAKALREKALLFLARREYGDAELRQKLSRYAMPEIVAQVVDALQAEGLQSDARFTEQWVMIRERRFGQRRIIADLKAKGVDKAVIETVIEANKASPEDEVKRAVEALSRKFYRDDDGHLDMDSKAHQIQDAKDRAKKRDKKIRFLQQRGFAFDIITKALKWDPSMEADSDLSEKFD